MVWIRRDGAHEADGGGGGDRGGHNGGNGGDGGDEGSKAGGRVGYAVTGSGGVVSVVHSR